MYCMRESNKAKLFPCTNLFFFRYEHTIIGELNRGGKDFTT